MWAPVSAVGVFGAALFFGDGFITPAISVLSAMEGLAVATPRLEHFVLPGRDDHPDRFCSWCNDAAPARWAGCSVPSRSSGSSRSRCSACAGSSPSPTSCSRSIRCTRCTSSSTTAGAGFVTLASVFLAVTGGEALYADMGHFGRAPIRRGWFMIVLPALVLNYFGQGALLLENPSAIANPFYLMAPGWLLPIAHRAGDRRDGDRFAGSHLRRVLDHAPGAQPRLSAAAARRCIPRKKRSARCTCRR